MCFGDPPDGDARDPMPISLEFRGGYRECRSIRRTTGALFVPRATMASFPCDEYCKCLVDDTNLWSPMSTMARKLTRARRLEYRRPRRRMSEVLRPTLQHVRPLRREMTTLVERAEDDLCFHNASANGRYLMPEWLRYRLRPRLPMRWS